MLSPAGEISIFPLVFPSAEGNGLERGAACPGSLRKRGCSAAFMGGKWELPAASLVRERGRVRGVRPQRVPWEGRQGDSRPQGWGFTLGEENPPSSSGEGAEEGMAAGFSLPEKTPGTKNQPTFELLRLQRKLAGRTKVHFRAQKLASN